MKSCNEYLCKNIKQLKDIIGQKDKANKQLHSKNKDLQIELDYLRSNQSMSWIEEEQYRKRIYRLEEEVQGVDSKWNKIMLKMLEERYGGNK